MSMSAQNNGSGITAASIENRLKHILDGSLHNLVENITKLITRYKELQKKLNEQTEEINALNEKPVDLTEIVPTIEPNISQISSNQIPSNTLEPEELNNYSKDELIRKLKEKDKQLIELAEQMRQFRLKQQLLESQRNETIDEMNRTSDSIIGQLHHISGNINAADGSSGGKLKTKKRARSNKRNKKTKTRVKKITLTRPKR